MNGKKVEIEGSYVINKQANIVSFQLGKYDKDLPLIIDPGIYVEKSHFALIFQLF